VIACSKYVAQQYFTSESSAFQQPMTIRGKLHSDGTGLASGMKTLLLATFNDLEPAQQLRDRLQQAGVPASIHDESKLERYGFISQPLAAVHVEVPPASFARAQALLGVWSDESDGLPSAVHCPECHSCRVEYPQLTRKFATPAVVGLFMAMKIIPRAYYCLDCQFTWPAVKPAAREFDILNFPTDTRIWPGERKHPATRT
jgi:hypothetical protein